MRDIPLSELLIERLASARAAISQQRITRRAFLTGLAASGLLLPMRAFATSPQPCVRWIGKALKISFGSSSWILDPGAFGAKANIRLRRHTDSYIVHLVRAILPGTQLRTDFTLKLSRIGGEWRANLTMPTLGFSGDATIRDWFGGKPITGHLKSVDFWAGGGQLQCSGGWLSIFARSVLTLQFNSPARLTGQIECSAASVQIAIIPKRNSTASRIGEVIEGSFVTAFTLDQPKLSDRAYASGQTDSFAALKVRHPETVTGEFFTNDGQLRQLALIDGPATLELRQRMQSIAPLEFERANVFIGESRLGIAGHLSKQTFLMPVGNCVASVRGVGEEPFCATYRVDEPAHFETSLAIEKLRLPVPDGDGGEIALDGQTIIVSSRAEVAQRRQQRDLIIVGNDPSLIMGLDGSVITIRRGRDLFELQFKFEYFELIRDRDGKLFIRRKKVKINGDFAYPEAFVTVSFPPQHIAETLTNIGEVCPKPAPQKINHLFSQPSRLVFKVPKATRRRDAKWLTRELTIEALTDWSDLEPCIHRRAQNDLDDLESQLDAAGITLQSKSLKLDEALGRIKQSLTAPTNRETSLELASDLIFSPYSKARWQLPQQAPDEGIPLFGVRIGHQDNARVRAIWSNLLPELTKQQFPEFGLEDESPKDLHSVSRKNHWGIVAQTSVYGLPALRRLVEDNKKGDPVNVALSKVPRGEIARPDLLKYPGAGYLEDVDAEIAGVGTQNPPPESGIALASPFENADITLTSLGASMRLLWHGEPPALKPNSYFEKSGISLQRLFYSTWLGRDELVLAVNKGYLFPLGIRAALLTIAERAYVPDINGRPVAIEIFRKRIVTVGNPKIFPGLNQPDGARDFPPTTVRMLTESSPDIDQDNGRILIPGYEALLAFWPKVEAKGHFVDVLWKCQIDDDKTAVVLPMIFIASDAAAVPDFVEKVVKAYNDPAEKAALRDEPWPQTNVALLNGTRRRYADSHKDGDTSFDTHSWLLRARGRTAGAGESFIMDARMNGADQPPFYPSVHRAKLTIQSIDRLLEKPVGLVEVKPYQCFVQQGFNDENEKAQIFLEVVRPLIKFDVSGQGEKSGGLAQPNSCVAALSRKSGIVGGSITDSAPSLMGKAKNGNAAAELQFSSAAKGVFSPKEFFNGKLNILGIDLIDYVISSAGDTLTSAPKLIENLDYGGMVGDSALPSIRRYAGEAKSKLENLTSQIGLAIEEINGQLKDTNLTFESLYPELATTLKSTLSRLIENLGYLQQNTVFENVPLYATPLIADCRPLITSIGAVLRNPIPPQVDKAVSDVIDKWNTLKPILDHALKNIAAQLLQEVVKNELETLFEHLEKEHETSLLFLLEDGEKLIDFLKDPAAAERIAHSLFVEQFGASILTMFVMLDDFIHQIDGVVTLAKSAIRARVQVAVTNALNIVANKIDVIAGQPEDNIGQSGGQTKLTNEIINLFVDRLDNLQIGTVDSAELEKRLKELDRKFEAGLEISLKKKIHDFEFLFHPSPGQDVDQIVTEFTSAITKPLVDTIVKLVRERRNVVLTKILQLGSDAPAVITRGAEVISALLNGGLAISDFVRIGKIVPDEWCSKANGVLAVATVLGDSLLGDESVLVTALSDIVQNTNAIQLPSATPTYLVRAFINAKKTLGDAIQQLSTAITELMAARARLRGFTQPGCVINLDLTQVVANCTDLRRATLTPLSNVAQSVAAIANVLAEVRKVLDDKTLKLPEKVRSAVCSLIGDLTMLKQAGISASWTIVRNGVNYFNNVGDKEFFGQLEQQRDTIEKITVDLRNELDHIEASDLPRFVNVTLQTLIQPEKRLTALFMQTVALPKTSLTRLETAALALVKKTADVMWSLHNSAKSPLNDVLTVINTYPVILFLIPQPAKNKFEGAVLAVGYDSNSLRNIRDAGDPNTAYSETKALVQRWSAGPIPLTLAISNLADFVDLIFQGKFGELIANQVRLLLQQLEESLKSLASQFLPTRLSTGFDWTTNLSPSAFFEMSSGVESPHLKLSSKISFDILSNKRTATLNGELQPFSIKLNPLAVINFEKVTFSANNGGSPDFRVKVKSVELGTSLSFISALQSWMSPQGSGFYIEPKFSGIKVGYAFAAGLIQVGSLQFINIAFDVYAELPFTNGAATFGFLFASPERPFLIANPPYGGGGWLKLITDAKGGKEITLSFMFGAVTTIKFGPLNGHGRICTGMSIAKDKKGDLTIQAIVEAVGDGNIACFSISIFIRITLTQYEGGLMTGEAIYRFNFRMGFFRFRYSVTATQKLQGGSKKPDPKYDFNVALDNDVAGLCVTSNRQLKTDAPLKSANWQKYRELIDIDLLDNAGVFS